MKMHTTLLEAIRAGITAHEEKTKDGIYSKLDYTVYNEVHNFLLLFLIDAIEKDLCPQDNGFLLELMERLKVTNNY